MDMIYTNKNHEDVGVLLDYSFDLEFGKDCENNFELTIDSSTHCCEDGCFVYMEGTEYGGIIDAMKVITKTDSLTYMGRTWHGILASKVIEPDSNENYLILSGEANKVIGTLLDRIGLSSLFVVSADDSCLTIKNYKMNRYVDAYTGIQKMLASASGKLRFTVQNGMVVLSAVPLVDYSQDEQFDTDQVELEIEKKYRHVNHLICLGSGELAQRQVIHLYANSNGEISKIQSLTGIDEVSTVYDYANVESLEELEAEGIEKLKEYVTGGCVKLSFDAESNVYDIGDIVGAKDIITGVEVATQISSKIVTINKGQISIEYKVGE